MDVQQRISIERVCKSFATHLRNLTGRVRRPRKGWEGPGAKRSGPQRVGDGTPGRPDPRPEEPKALSRTGDAAKN